jgi:hypothetical protein
MRVVPPLWFDPALAGGVVDLRTKIEEEEGRWRGNGRVVGGDHDDGVGRSKSERRARRLGLAGHQQPDVELWTLTSSSRFDLLLNLLPRF